MKFEWHSVAEKEIKRLTKKLKEINKLEQLDRDLTIDEQNKMFKKDDIVRKLEALKLDWLHSFDLNLIIFYI